MYFGPLAVAGIVCLSFDPSFYLFVCLDIFLELDHYFFSKFWHATGNLNKVVRGRARFFAKIFCASKVGEIGQKYFFWICLKTFSLIFFEFVLWWKFILFVLFLHKSQIWENYCSWDIFFFFQPIAIFLNHLFLYEIAWYFACWYQFIKIKSLSKIGMTNKTVCISRMDRWSKLFFLDVDKNSQKCKADQKLFEWAWSTMCDQCQQCVRSVRW